MSKILTNREYIQKLIIPAHKPNAREVGDQREPWTIIGCSCKQAIPKYEDGEWYPKHLLAMIEASFPELFKEQIG